MKHALLLALTPLLLLTAGAARSPIPSYAPKADPASTPDQPLPRQSLDDMDRAELGHLYTPQLAAKLPDAHLLLEKYFAAPAKADRAAALAQLKALNLDPVVLGRITRIRLYWPELQPGVYYVNERVGPHNIIYFFGIPKGYDRTKPFPLVVKLPGAHPFITDPPPKADQVQQLYTTWVQDEIRAHPDAIVLMPLLNLDELWGPSYKGMNSVIQPIFHIAARANIDPARLYLTGHAMSGHATWNLALHYPTFFAAINPMSGGASLPFQRLRLVNLRNILAVTWHDEEDTVVKVESTRTIVKALKDLKFDVDYEETKGVGHAPTDEIATRFYDKMRKRTRQLYPRQVSLASNRPDTLFNRNDWLQVYQMLAAGKEKKASVLHGTGTITFQENSYSITASITAPNRIEITSSNVESMRIYVNDQMIDFSKPVTVFVNRRPRFEGLVKPSLDDMLADQLFLGRGLRYYTGVIDVDFGALPASRPATTPATRRGIIEYTPPQ